MIREYNKEVAEQLMGLLGETLAMELQDAGVYMRKEWKDTARIGADWLNWTPQCLLLQPDRQILELLPIPFSGRQLAAFMICPVADDLLAIFGEGGRLDMQALIANFGGIQDGMCKLAIEEAYEHLARAVAEVGPKNNVLWQVQQRIAQDYEQERDAARNRLGIALVSGHGLSAKEYTLRIDQVNAEVSQMKAAVVEARNRAEAEEVNWLRRMTRAIFEGESCLGDTDNLFRKRGTQPSLNEQQKAEIIKQYRGGQGITVLRLAGQYGVSRRTIDKVLGDANLKKITPRKGRTSSA